MMLQPSSESLRGRRALVWIHRKHALVWFVSAITLASGLVNLYSVIGPALPERAALLAQIFSIEVVHFSRFLTLLIGFALVTSSVNLYKRKKRAYQAVLLMAAASILFHLTKGLDYEEAAMSLALAAILLLSRKEFTVLSSTPDFRLGLLRLAIAIGVAFAYGVAGFWFLDPREFGINFTIGDSIHRTLHFLSLSGDPQVVPLTRYAHWFLRSLNMITGVALGYAIIAVFRPVVYRYRTLPHERRHAEALVKKYGRTATDFFKYWPDKSFYFTPSGECFLAYRVGGGYAMVLGDPVGPEAEIESAILGFGEFCRQNDWGVAYHHVPADFLPIYRKAGYRRLKVGDEAIVDLASFRMEGRQLRKIQSKMNQFEKQGIRLMRYAPPLTEECLAQAAEVSESWLQIPGRRERTFTLGSFDLDYLRGTPLYAALDANGKMLAFVNEIPSYCPGEVTLDLMRHRTDAPPGIMDYVFTKVLLAKKAEGAQRFNLGMAPMSGFQETEESTLEERAVHYFAQRLHFLFSYQGLRFYKAKFATHWEPQYLVYRQVLQLPRIANALSEVSEIRD
jgi:phosphatidylglycerol lysyltransferase